MLQPSLNLSTRRRLVWAIDANHREQQRLSHELHDGLGQDVAGLAYLANAVAKKAERTQSLLARGISPLTESDGSLIAALRGAAEEANRRPGTVQAIRNATAGRCIAVRPAEPESLYGSA